MARLGVNIDHVATVRQARRVAEPDPVQAAVLAELGGAEVCTVHLRPTVKTLQDGGLEVSLFIDPDLEQVKESHKLDAHAIEINTAAYADARDARTRETALRRAVREMKEAMRPAPARPV